MNHYKPCQTIKDQYSFELYIELFFIFVLFCFISFFAPMFLALKLKLGMYFDFLRYFYDQNKMAASYPFIAIVEFCATFMYGWMQSRERKVIEVIDNKDYLLLKLMNGFTGKVYDRSVYKDDLYTKVINGRMNGAVIKIYESGKYIASFRPLAKPWDKIRDRVVIDEIGNLLDGFNQSGR